MTSTIAVVEGGRDINHINQWDQTNRGESDQGNMNLRFLILAMWILLLKNGIKSFHHQPCLL